MNRHKTFASTSETLIWTRSPAAAKTFTMKASHSTGGWKILLTFRIFTSIRTIILKISFKYFSVKPFTRKFSLQRPWNENVCSIVFTMVQWIYPRIRHSKFKILFACIVIRLFLTRYLFTVKISNLTSLLNCIWRSNWRMPAFIVTICVALVTKFLNLLRCFPIPMRTIINIQSFELFGIFYYLSPVDVFIMEGTQITKKGVNPSTKCLSKS